MLQHSVVVKSTVAVQRLERKLTTEILRADFSRAVDTLKAIIDEEEGRYGGEHWWVEARYCELKSLQRASAADRADQALLAEAARARSQLDRLMASGKEFEAEVALHAPTTPAERF